MIRKILCYFWHHKYFVLKELRPYSRKLGCRYCNRIFMMNDDCKAVILWDKDFDDLELYIKRQLDGMAKAD